MSGGTAKPGRRSPGARLFIWAVLTAAGLCVAGVAGGVVISHTAAGRGLALDWVLGRLRPEINGSLTVGSVSPGGLLGGATLHDVRISDIEGHTVLVVDSVRASYSLASFLGGPPGAGGPGALVARRRHRAPGRKAAPARQPPRVRRQPDRRFRRGRRCTWRGGRRFRDPGGANPWGHGGGARRRGCRAAHPGDRGAAGADRDGHGPGADARGRGGRTGSFLSAGHRGAGAARHPGHRPRPRAHGRNGGGALRAARFGGTRHHSHAVERRRLVGRLRTRCRPHGADGPGLDRREVRPRHGAGRRAHRDRSLREPDRVLRRPGRTGVRAPGVFRRVPGGRVRALRGPQRPAGAPARRGAEPVADRPGGGCGTPVGRCPARWRAGAADRRGTARDPVGGR